MIAQIISTTPRDIINIWRKGRVHFLYKEYEKAEQCFQYISKKFPQFPFAFRELGRIQLQREEWESAVYFFSKAISLNEKLACAYIGRGIAYQAQNKINLAMNEFAMSLTWNQKNILAYYALARVYLEQKRNKDALLITQQAKKYFPEFALSLEQSIKRVTFPLAKQYKKETKHYKVDGNESKEYINFVAFYLEQIIKKYEEIIHIQIPYTYKVYIFKQRKQLCLYANIKTPEQYNHKLALWWPVSRELLVSTDTHPVFWKKYLTREAIKQIVHRISLHSCMRKGLIEYFGNCAGNYEFIWKSIPVHEKKQIQKGAKYFSIAKMFSYHKNPYSYGNYERDCYSFVYFLLYAKNGKYRSLLQKYMRIISQGNTNKAKALMNTKEMETNYIQYWLNK